ncbi:heterogeneous nuclear ribonucleoprotein-related [Holotrichia oblita]|uniref:Heterogeneous nuclear ribonucleoprotein-related n=1 Tax=Holotrichia oblita TaxID=644536 RepID=A0ACB9TW41_HOLOL|nr:heterogeneous nuclear ribonucleoprotein-related [Holotrichia oblita]
MSVIIRLQNLPWSANALDIRQYFHGLSIPEGGVHIVGGELGDAFIAFSTDEDARQAFNLNNGKIKGIQIKLMLSSRTEMQKVIEAARNHSLAAFMPTPTPIPAPDQKLDKRDKRRSRSRSRDRKDRSRDRDRRDRRRRERSRTRSRERRERRRRERSRSRDRTRSKERDRRSKDRRTPEKPDLQQPKEQKIVWEAPQPTPEAIPNIPANLVGTYATLLASNIANNPTTLLDPQNGFQKQFVPRWNTNTNESQNSFQRPRFLPDDRFNDQNQNQGRGRLLNQFNENRGGQNFNTRPQQSLNNRMDNNSNSRFNDRQPVKESTNCCIQLQPYYGGFGEVRRFFQGIFISNTGIKFVNDEFGKRTGVVYVRFAYPEGKDEALQRDGNLLKGQEVEVNHLDDVIFEETVDRFQRHSDNFSEEDSEDSRFNKGKNITKYFNKNSQTPPTPKVFSSLVVEDLPTYAKEQDILKMFSDYSLTSIILLNKPRKVHVAYVQFNNLEDAKGTSRNS